MEKKLTFKLASAALLAGALVSCNEQLELVAGTSADDLAADKIAEFEQAFIERFGEPDPNHSWGFDDSLLPIFDAETRGVGDVNVNRNQWCDFDRLEGEDAAAKFVYKDHAIAQKFQVPGWPNEDGYFYTSTGPNALMNIYNRNQVVANHPQPIGDVTDYEIQYVSTWFRTHYKPTSVPLHLTDFFVQNISQDNDQLYYTGSVTGTTQDLGDLDEPGYNGPNAIHVSDVLGASGNDKVNASYVPNVTRLDGPSYNSNEELNYRMDYLHFGNMASTEGGKKHPDGFNNVTDDKWTHVNNFNRGSSNYNPEEMNDNNIRVIEFVTSSGTENFACRPSMGTGNNWIDEWVLVRLEWEEVMADGNSHKRSGYYLGFDFQTQSGSTKIDYDGYYSNWIIKISPANFTHHSNYSRRVMCEDLGGSFDFDFNDVVFDVAYDARTQENIVAIQAAGGTLPICVGSTDPKLEAHYLLGQNLDDTDLIPTNVEENGRKHTVAIYRVKNTSVGENVVANIYNMPINVKQNGSWVNVANKSMLNYKDYEWEEEDKVNHSTGHYNKNEDKVPRKFAVPVGVKWAKELTGVDRAYWRFHDWVDDSNFKYPANGKQLEWYNAPGDDRNIYEYDKQQSVNIDGTSATTIEQWMAINVVSTATDFDNQKLATEIVSINGYDGANSIIGKLTNESLNKHQVTFAYILKAQNGAIPAGRMIPVWIEDNKPYYVSPTGVKTEITPTMLKSSTFDWVEGTFQPGFYQNSAENCPEPTDEQKRQGIDGLGYKTYICKFSFDAHSIYYEEDGTKHWCDYIMFFEKEDVNMETSTSTNWNGTAYSSGVTRPIYYNPVKKVGNVIWYETYCIL